MWKVKSFGSKIKPIDSETVPQVEDRDIFEPRTFGGLKILPLEIVWYKAGSLELQSWSI